ncbi:DUF5610 domain-containing protein [Chitinimonas sp. JJ19]|uniref:DUF5610 domain-containing protein n=1 Tax=Chitinimonas sp. JJ19 TaxID=3109352 RepID=UPI001A44A54E|nr:DUF5610 domain-containing protein [Chitinimonas sp.]
MKLASLDAGQQAQAHAPHAATGKAADKAKLGLEISHTQSSYSFSASFSEGNNHLKLVLQTSYEAISVRARIALPEGEALPEPAEYDPLDVSPEATAKRIVDLSTGFYELFKQQRPDEDEASVLDNFMQTIGKGVAQGFAEAREILDSLGVLKDQIASNIDKTWELVQNGLQAFAKLHMPAKPDSAQ